MKKKLTLFTSTFNSELHIQEFVKVTMKKIERSANYKLNEFIIVDDGSRDKTVNTLRSIGEINENIRIVPLAKNIGQHAALKLAFDSAAKRSDFYILIDSDLEENIDDLLSQDLSLNEDKIIFTKDIGSKKNNLYWLSANIFFVIAFLLGINYKQRNIRMLRIFSEEIFHEIRKSDTKILMIEYFEKYYNKSRFIPTKRIYKGDSEYNVPKLINMATQIILGNYKKWNLLVMQFAITLIFFSKTTLTNLTLITISNYVLTVIIFGQLYKLKLRRIQNNISIGKMTRVSAKYEVEKYYSKKAQLHGISHLALDWKSKANMGLRFDVITSNIELSEIESCTDFGCGWAPFLAHLRELKYTGQYVGIDISKKMIMLANNQYGIQKNHRFILGDIIEYKTDLVVCSGNFNVKGKFDNESWTEYFVKPILENVIEMTRKQFVINFLKPNPDRPNDNLYFVDEKTITDFILKINPSINLKIISNYPLFEWTCIGSLEYK